MFFQWRAARAGAEKFHSAMVPHTGVQNSRTWREVVALGQELRTLSAVLPARVLADVAILWDWESWWALELDSKPSAGLNFLDQLRSYYDPLFAANITVDFAAPDADLSGYRLVLVPNLYLLRDAAAQNLERFVAGGGTCVISFFSGIVDEHEQIRLGGYPAPLRALLGLWVEEFVPYAPEETNTIEADDGSSYLCRCWSDVIHLEGAAVLAHYTGGFYAGRAAVTRHAFGQGVACYVGTRPDAAGMAALLERACRDAGVAAAFAAPAGVEAVRRQTETATLLYLLNHRAEAVEIVLDQDGVDLISGQELSGRLTLGAHGVAIVAGGRPLPV